MCTSSSRSAAIVLSGIVRGVNDDPAQSAAGMRAKRATACAVRERERGECPLSARVFGTVPGCKPILTGVERALPASSFRAAACFAPLTPPGPPFAPNQRDVSRRERYSQSRHLIRGNSCINRSSVNAPPRCSRSWYSCWRLRVEEAARRRPTASPVPPTPRRRRPSMGRRSR